MYQHFLKIDWTSIGTVVGVLIGVFTLLGLRPQLLKRAKNLWQINPWEINKRVKELEHVMNQQIEKKFAELTDTVIKGHERINSSINDIKREQAWNGQEIANLNSAREMMTFRTAPSGEFVSVNAQMVRELNHPYKEFMGFNFVNLLPAEERRPFLKRYKDAVDNMMIIDELVIMRDRSFHFKAEPVMGNGQGFLGYSGVVEPAA